MVLINDDQGDIADIVLDVWLFDQKSNHPSLYYGLRRPPEVLAVEALILLGHGVTLLDGRVNQVTAKGVTRHPRHWT